MLYTSYFSNPRLKKTTKRKVSIAIGVPKNWQGDRDLRLAPSWAMLRMSSEDYYRIFARMLAKLNPHEIAKQYDDCILLCWEKDDMECHRSYVARWLRDAGYQVQEYIGDGVDLSFDQMLALW
jgi:hypothetical protein